MAAITIAKVKNATTLAIASDVEQFSYIHIDYFNFLRAFA
jgi:hypothetical protein